MLTQLSKILGTTGEKESPVVPARSDRISDRISDIIVAFLSAYKFRRLVPENPDLPENRIENKKSGRTMTVAAAKLV